ncbi:MAG: hypothetical protein H0W72_07375, partial [Planctomycetes bacterium]|nr:hypothetical protein [Planctomycetota bacterium]
MVQLAADHHAGDARELGMAELGAERRLHRHPGDDALGHRAREDAHRVRRIRVAEDEQRQVGDLRSGAGAGERAQGVEHARGIVAGAAQAVV